MGKGAIDARSIWNQISQLGLERYLPPLFRLIVVDIATGEVRHGKDESGITVLVLLHDGQVYAIALPNKEMILVQGGQPKRVL